MGRCAAWCPGSLAAGRGGRQQRRAAEGAREAEWTVVLEERWRRAGSGAWEHRSPADRLAGSRAWQIGVLARVFEQMRIGERPPKGSRWRRPYGLGSRGLEGLPEGQGRVDRRLRRGRSTRTSATTRRTTSPLSWGSKDLPAPTCSAWCFYFGYKVDRPSGSSTPEIEWEHAATGEGDEEKGCRSRSSSGVRASSTRSAEEAGIRAGLVLIPDGVHQRDARAWPRSWARGGRRWSGRSSRRPWREIGVRCLRRRGPGRRTARTHRRRGSARPRLWPRRTSAKGTAAGLELDRAGSVPWPGAPTGAPFRRARRRARRSSRASRAGAPQWISPAATIDAATRRSLRGPRRVHRARAPGCGRSTAKLCTDDAARIDDALGSHRGGLDRQSGKKPAGTRRRGCDVPSFAKDD